MACKINRDTKGNITRVDDKSGNESVLFNNIVSHPLVGDSELALNIYKNTFLPVIGEDAQWMHKVDSLFTPDYKEALTESEIGQEIQVGFINTEGRFFPIISTTKNTNRDTLQGFINSSIESGVLSQKKNNDGSYEAYGRNSIQKAVNTELVHQDAKLHLGVEGVKKDGNALTFEKTKGRLKLETKNSGTERVKYEDIDMMPYEEISKKYQNPEYILLDREMYRQQPAYRDTKFETNIPTRTERELQISLLNLLTKLGVKTLPLSEYLSKYESRNGVAPSATALADIANQIISYTQGEISLSDLTEETSHFLVEAMPKEGTENIIRNIHRTEEWTQFSDQYREIYRKDYSGEELEEAVRREVLGKVVKNSIENNFQTEDKTPVQGSIISSIKGLLSNFFQNVQNLFKTKYKTQLDSYLEDINNIIKSQDISSLDTDNFKNNKHRLYSAKPSNTKVTQINKAAKRIISGLENQIRALSKDTATATKKRKLQKAQENLKDTTSLSAIADIVEMSKNDIKYIQRALKDSEENNKDYVLSSEEATVFSTLKNLIGPSLKELQALTTKEQLEQANISHDSNWKILNSEIEGTITELSTLEGQVSEKKSNNINRIVDEIVDKYDFPDDTRDNLLKWAEQAEKDTNYAYALIGSLANANDGMLSTLGYLIRKMHTQADTDYIPSAQKMQKDLRDLGFDETFFKKEMRDGNYIISPYDFNRLEKDLDKIFIDTYKDVVGTDLSDKDIIKKRNKGELNIPFEKQTEFKEKKRSAEQPLRERPMKDSYYKKYDEITERANISNVTKTVLSDYLSDMSVLKKKATREDGTVDWSTLSKAQQEEWANLTSTRKEYKSILDKTGQLKRGLEYSYDKDGKIETDSKGRPVVNILDNPSEEAQVAYDINKLDDIFRKENEKQGKSFKGIPNRFLEDIDRVESSEGREKAIDFLYANAYIGMDSDFWENQNTEESLLERLEGNGNIDLHNRILEKKTHINSILKEYSRKNQPSEVEGSDIPDITKQSIKQAQEQLELLYAQARQSLPEQEEVSERDTISSANDSYIDHINALGIENPQDEFDEAKHHMTADKESRVRKTLQRIDNFSNGSGSLSQRDQEYYDEQVENMSFSKEDILDNMKRRAIRDALLPYYKKYTSAAYEVFSTGLSDANSGVSVRSIIEDAGNYQIEVSPNYSFYDNTENDQINPNYDPDFKGGYFQPNQSYRNDKFYSSFPVGSKKREAYDLVMDWYEKGLSAAQLGKGYNIYQKPQVRKGFNERWETTIKDPKRLALAFKDAFVYTDDDMIQGDQTIGADIKVIPKRFVYRIEDPEDVSDELFYSMNLMVQEGYLRKARIDSYGDIMTVFDSIKKDERYGNIDKKAESTNTYKVAKNYIDHSLFSIQEEVIYKVTNPINGKKIDLTKFIKNIVSFVKFKNLAFSPIIALTSLFTATAVRKQEAMVGQILDVRSQRLGAREYANLATNAMKEFGTINNTSKLNVLGQQLGSFSIEESFRNSNYGKLGRLLPKLSMGVHTLANHPSYSKVFLGVLHDYRVIDGKVQRWNPYKIEQKKLGKSNKEIRAEWDAQEDKVIYNYVDVVDGQVEWKDKELSEQLNNYDRQKLIDRIRGQVSAVNERIDGQRNNNMRSVLQRDFRLSLFGTHRSWLAIALESAFKSRSVNFDTGQVEAGIFTSASDYLKNYMKIVRNTGKGNILKGFKKAYEEGDDADKANIKRLGVQMAMLNAILLIGTMLRMADDDEDKNYGLTAANLMLARVGNELNSASTALPKSVWETLETPFIGLDLLSNIGKVGEAFDDDIVTRGTYRGLSKGQRYWIRSTPTKAIFDLSNTQRLNNNLNTYLYYNSDTVEGPLYAPLNHFLIKNTLKKEE